MISQAIKIRSEFMTVAILTAAGVGSRFGTDVPKQFLTVYNKPIIIYTLEKFENHPGIDAILVTCLSGWEPVLEAYAKQYKISKLKWIVKGGKTGQESIKNGINVLSKELPEDTIVLVHDGNRALVSSDIISNSIAKCKEKGNAITIIPCQEVIVETKDQESSNVYFERENLKRTQTPHTFYLKDLVDAHKEAEEKGIVNAAATCDLMMKLGKTIYFSQGNEKNIKITTTDDMEIFKALVEHDE